MLIIKITKAGKVTYYGCVSIEVDTLDSDGSRRVKMRCAAGVKWICDLGPADAATILNHVVLL